MEHVAVLGIGLMGRAIADRLHAGGHRVTVYNRTKEKCEPLRLRGIRVADDPAEAISSADCTLLVLSDAPAIQAVLGTTSARESIRGRTVVQMGTISSLQSLTLQRDIEQGGGQYLEAPFLGSIAEAATGTLLVMVGGTAEQFARWLPLFRSLSGEPRHIGSVGQAAVLKLALNQLIAAETSAFGLSLGLVRRSNIPVERFMAVLRDSALHAPTFDKKLPRILARNYADPNFSVTHLLKDVDLFTAEADSAGLASDGLEPVRRWLRDLIAEGRGGCDYSALFDRINPSR